MIQPGLCSVTYRALAPAAVVVLAQDAGLAAIEWGGDRHVPPGDLDLARRVGRLTEAAGLQVSSYGSYLRPPTDGATSFAAVLETALALGAPMIRVWPGARDRPSLAYTPAERAAVVSLLAAFAAAAAEHGVAIGLEYHPGTLTDDAGSALALVRAVGASNLYLYWQPRPGLPLAEARAELALLGGEVAHLHVFAWDAASARYHLSSAGEYWKAVLRALPPTRWTGPRYAMLEFVPDDAPEVLGAEADSLRDILAS